MSTRFKPKFNIRKGDKVVVIAGDDKDLTKYRTVKKVLVGHFSMKTIAGEPIIVDDQ